MLEKLNTDSLFTFFMAEDFDWNAENIKEFFNRQGLRSLKVQNRYVKKFHLRQCTNYSDRVNIVVINCIC